MATTEELLTAVERLERQSRRWLPFSVLALGVIMTGVVYSTMTLAHTQSNLAAAEQTLETRNREITAAERRLAAVTAKLKVSETQLHAAVSVGSNALAHENSGAVVGNSSPGQRWLYLGSYRADQKRWQTKYLEFADDADPATFIDHDLTVREETGALNVRPGLPNDEGLLPKSIDVLKPGRRVRIVEVKRWSASPFYFARIDDQPVNPQK